jgi:signal transduction histidine kinase
VEPILAEWESFARGIWPEGARAEPAEMRDDAEDILRATTVDMQSNQTPAQEIAKSKGASRDSGEGDELTRASMSHGIGRVASGFELWAVVAEYRALRASVLRLWRQSEPTSDVRDLDDVTRFNESMDQSLAHAVRSYAEQIDRDREALWASEQASREAEAANRAKDLFLATLSHEMRTPLNAIVGWLSILRHEDAETRHFQEGLKVIERNTMAQVQLIDDLLDVSRIVSGKLRVKIQPLRAGRDNQRRCKRDARDGRGAGHHVKRAA